MAGKVERLRSQLRNMRESTERAARNVVHAGETLVLGGGTAYLEGRMADETGEWGYRGVPYAYMGGAVLFLTGLFASDRWSADLFAAGSGVVGGHFFRTMYEAGQESRSATTGGRRQIPARQTARQMPMPGPNGAVQSNAVPVSAGLGGLR